MAEIEDFETVKDQLPCGEQMDFPSTFDEFAKDYGFKDKNEIYTNGSELIPVFRVKQWLEHISTTKNDLSSETRKNSQKLAKDFGELDCISRADAIRVASGYCHPSNVAKELAKLPSVTPQEPTDKNFTKADIDAIAKAINKGWELRVNEILSKIRAEIEQLTIVEGGDDYVRKMAELFSLKMKVLQIIDKYKADTEKA